MFFIDTEKQETLGYKELREKAEIELSRKLKESSRAGQLEECIAEILCKPMNKEQLTGIYNYCRGKEEIITQNTLRNGGGDF